MNLLSDRRPLIGCVRLTSSLGVLNYGEKEELKNAEML